MAPADIAAAAVKGGYAAIALTDHDNCDGTAEFLSARTGGDTLRIAGIELSIQPGEGFDKFHLLGLGVDPSCPELKSLMRRVLEGRNGRNARILERFAEIGIMIPKDEIALYAHGEVLARPHFAKWLVDHGYAPDVKSAFDSYLVPDCPSESCCYVGRWRPTQEEAFAAVHAAGGLCVMAHPRYWCDAWKREGCDFAAAERELARLRASGLDGLEALYQANTPEENVEFVRIADRTGLLKTAGSDFHGAAKVNVTMGMEVSRSFISPFLDALSLAGKPHLHIGRNL